MSTSDTSPEPGRPDHAAGDRPAVDGPAPQQAPGQQPPPAWQQPPSGPQPPPSWQQPPFGQQPPPSWQQPPFGQQPPPSWQQPPSGQQPPAGQRPPAWSTPPRHESTAGFFDSLRRTGIWRGEDRWIGGVAAGVARRLDVDPLLVRGVLVVMTFFGGLGLLLYGLGWALLPEESDGRIHLQEALRGNVDAALAGAVAFAVVGLSRPGTWWGGWDYWGGGWFIFGLAVVALIVVAVSALSGRGSRPRPPAGPPSPGQGEEGFGPGSGSGPQSWSAPPPPAAAARSEAEPTTAYGRAAYGDAGPGPTYAAAPTYSSASAAASAAPTYHGAPTAYAGTPTTYATPQPPVPPRPRTPGPGSAVVAVVLAMCLLATAALLLWDLTSPQGWLLPVTIGGALLLLLGAGVMISGLRGRRGGALAVLGVLLALLVVPATLASTVAPFHQSLATGAGFGDRTFSPTSPASAADGYHLVAGDLEVDLAELDLSGGPVTVPLSLGAGDLNVILPEGEAVRIEAELGAGRIEGRTEPGWSGPMSTTDASAPVLWADGNSIDATFLSPAAQEDDPTLVVQLHVGAGNIHIEEQR